MLKNIIVILLILVFPLFPSGGYDHGTSTGKGQLELDLLGIHLILLNLVKRMSLLALD